MKIQIIAAALVSTALGTSAFADAGPDLPRPVLSSAANPENAENFATLGIGAPESGTANTAKSTGAGKARTDSGST
ncbi:hypothetical protein [Paraburkholderia fungorum]|uniref:hypothetical protein n=1 Tax=Paraburkholderia fungorum TaxID=134537 RepID=UPI0033138CFA